VAGIRKYHWSFDCFEQSDCFDCFTDLIVYKKWKQSIQSKQSFISIQSIQSFYIKGIHFMSRPTKRTPDRVAAILQALDAGHTRKVATAAGGICEETFRRWVVADPQLQQQVAQAEAVAERSLVECIQRAGEVDWRAAAWLLERRNPAAWSIRYQQELLIRTATTEPMKVIVEYVDYADTAKLLE
jgi:hypothetical protein